MAWEYCENCGEQIATIECPCGIGLCNECDCDCDERDDE